MLFFNLCRKYLCLIFLKNVHFNVWKDLKERKMYFTKSFLPWLQAPKVKSDETQGSHGSHSVRRVYLCENPPSPNKVKSTSMVCVMRRQMTECHTKPDNGLFISEWKETVTTVVLVINWKELQLVCGNLRGMSLLQNHPVGLLVLHNT